MFAKTVLRVSSPTLWATADSVDFEGESLRLLQRLDGHVEQLAEYCDHVEAQRRKIEMGQLEAGEELERREAHIGRLAKSILGIPQDQPLPDPAQKFNIIRNAVREYRDGKGLKTPGLVEAVNLHAQEQADTAPIPSAPPLKLSLARKDAALKKSNRWATLDKWGEVPEDIVHGGVGRKLSNNSISSINSRRSASVSETASQMGGSRPSLKMSRVESYSSFRTALNESNNSNNRRAEAEAFASCSVTEGRMTRSRMASKLTGSSGYQSNPGSVSSHNSFNNNSDDTLKADMTE